MIRRFDTMRTIFAEYNPNQNSIDVYLTNSSFLPCQYIPAYSYQFLCQHIKCRNSAFRHSYRNWSTYQFHHFSCQVSYIFSINFQIILPFFLLLFFGTLFFQSFLCLFLFCFPFLESFFKFFPCFFCSRINLICYQYFFCYAIISIYCISALYSQIPIISVIHNLLAKIAVP